MRTIALLLTCIAASAGCVLTTEDDALSDEGYPPPAIAIASPVSGATVTGVVAVLASASAAAGAASVRFDFPDGTSLTDTAPPFSASWDSAAVIDGGHAITATAIDERGAASSASVAIVVANGGCLDTALVAPGLPRVVPDDRALGIESSLLVLDRATVAGLALSLRVSHPFPQDLDISLISPAGAAVALGALPVDPDAGGLAIDDLPITAFDGQSATGTWRLAVRDLEAGGVGTLDAWSLSFTGVCNP